MKLSLSLMKLIIKLLILMMLFVLMFLISSFLYSARYWPDVYNYINANITIKRIPTISELELTVIEVDYTTEMYSYGTTDVDYIDISTIDDFDIDEFMKEEFDYKRKAKRNIVIEQLKDYIELPPRGIFVDYIFLEEPITTVRNLQDEDTKSKELDDETNNIFKTSVTGFLIDDELSKNTKKEVSEEPAVTQKYYTVQDKVKRCVTEETITNKLEIISDVNTVTAKYSAEHSTTKEGYLVGDEINSNNIVDEDTEEPVVITTETNENDLVDEELGFRIQDSVDVSKLFTRGPEDVEMVSRKPEKLIMPDRICHGDVNCQGFAMSVFPWIVTIFVTNDTKDSQFSYYCDGALLTEKVIITDARCMYLANKTRDPENVLVFLGKGNLQVFGGNEKVHKIKEIIIHPNFTMKPDNNAVNELALLVMEDAVIFRDNIQSACIHQEIGGQGATTAWGPNGALIPIIFHKNKSDACYDKDDDIFCATYGPEVPLCPSYGGVYATKQADRWCLHAIFYGDPSERGICFTKDVYYTSLKKYLKWIDETVELNNRNDV